MCVCRLWALAEAKLHPSCGHGYLLTVDDGVDVDLPTVLPSPPVAGRGAGVEERAVAGLSDAGAGAGDTLGAC